MSKKNLKYFKDTRKKAKDPGQRINKLNIELFKRNIDKYNAESSMLIGGSIGSNFENPCTIEKESLGDTEYDIGILKLELCLSNGCQKKIVLKNLNIQILSIQHGRNITYQFENCRIGDLKLSCHADVRIVQTAVDKFLLSNITLGSLELDENSSLGEINIRGGNEGTVELYSHDFSLSEDSTLFREFSTEDSPALPVRQYEMLVSILNHHSNTFAARVVKANIRRMKRNKESRFIRFCSKLYDEISGYALYPLRSLMFLLLLTLFSITLIYSFNGTTITLKCKSEKTHISDWRKSVCLEKSEISRRSKKDIEKKIYRSILLAIQPITNPIGFYQKNSIVIASHWWINIWLFFQWLLTIIGLWLFLLSVHSRFKLA